MQDWINSLFENPEMLTMGHSQRLDDLNLGLGWLYYGLVRVTRPKVIVVIGSWRGFSPLILAKGIQDNLEIGKVIFIDPSFVDDFWTNKENVQEHFNTYGINNIEHFLLTTQEFIKTETYLNLEKVDILFIDGYHSQEQAKFDYEAFEHLITSNSFIWFHDSIAPIVSDIYGEEKSYTYTVYQFIDELKQKKNLQVLDFDFDSGVTLVRKLDAEKNSL